MPMIDIYAAAGTFVDPHQVAQDAAIIVKTAEAVPDIPMFRQNTAGFVHELPAVNIADTEGASDHVRVQVITNTGALDRDKQLAVVAQLTDLVVTASRNEGLRDRTRVLLTEATAGGWGLWGHAQTNEELVTAARSEIASLQAKATGED